MKTNGSPPIACHNYFVRRLDDTQHRLLRHGELACHGINAHQDGNLGQNSSLPADCPETLSTLHYLFRKQPILLGRLAPPTPAPSTSDKFTYDMLPTAAFSML